MNALNEVEALPRGSVHFLVISEGRKSMPEFKVHADFEPMGDQPKAIETPVSYTHLTLPTTMLV